MPRSSSPLLKGTKHKSHFPHLESSICHVQESRTPLALQLKKGWCRLFKVSSIESEQGLTCWLEHLALVSFSVWQAGFVGGCSGWPMLHGVPSESSGKPPDDVQCLLAHSSPRQTNLPCRRPTSGYQALSTFGYSEYMELHHMDSAHNLSLPLVQSSHQTNDDRNYRRTFLRSNRLHTSIPAVLDTDQALVLQTSAITACRAIFKVSKL